MSSRVKFTLGDYLALDEPDGPHYELSDGELLYAPSESAHHNNICSQLWGRIEAHLSPDRLGVVTGSVDFLLGQATVRRPDVAVIFSAGWRREYGDMVPVPVAPDLVFEILSGGGVPGAIRLKTRQFLAAGTQAVWLFDASAGDARRYAVQGGESALTAAVDRVCEEPLLPGFRLDLAELFRSAL